MRTVIRMMALCLLLGVFVACGATPPSVPTAPPAPITPTPAADLVIVAMGDSLTEGLGVDMADAYPAQLERKLRAAGYSATVVNAGVSGETSTGALARVDWVLRQQPDIVILATGGNDGLRGIEPAVTAKAIDQIVEKLQTAGAVVVLPGMEMVQNMGKEYTSQFHAIYPDVAKRRGAILMPFFLEGVAADPTLNQPDFIHPTAEGYTVVVDHLYPYVVQAIERSRALP